MCHRNLNFYHACPLLLTFFIFHSTTETNTKRLSLFLAATSSKSRKRKAKMETALEVFAEKIGSTFNNDDTELQLKVQAAQHAHEIKMFTLFSQFMERSQHFPHPPNYQAPVLPPSMQPPHLYNQRQPPPQHSHSSFTQAPPFHMASLQSLPFSHETPNQSCHSTTLLHTLQILLHPFTSTRQASAHPPFSRPLDDDVN